LSVEVLDSVHTCTECRVASFVGRLSFVEGLTPAEFLSFVEGNEGIDGVESLFGGIPEDFKATGSEVGGPTGLFPRCRRCCSSCDRSAENALQCLGVATGLLTEDEE
jgi:hypothetical protein